MENVTQIIIIIELIIGIIIISLLGGVILRVRDIYKDQKIIIEDLKRLNLALMTKPPPKVVENTMEQLLLNLKSDEMIIRINKSHNLRKTHKSQYEADKELNKDNYYTVVY